MMEARFTKGPWVAFQNEIGSWEVNCRTNESGGVGRHSPTICTTWDVTYTELNNKLQEPNAHLIAAAPEMYEMLSKIAESTVHDKNYATAKPIFDLLAKARGE